MPHRPVQSRCVHPASGTPYARVRQLGRLAPCWAVRRSCLRFRQLLSWRCVQRTRSRGPGGALHWAPWARLKPHRLDSPDGSVCDHGWSPLFLDRLQQWWVMKIRCLPGAVAVSSLIYGAHRSACESNYPCQPQAADFELRTTPETAHWPKCREGHSLAGGGRERHACIRLSSRDIGGGRGQRLSRGRRRRLSLGRPHAAAGDEAAACGALRPDRPGGARRAGRHLGRWRYGRGRRAHAARGRRGVRRGGRGNPRAGRARRHDRRPAGAQQGHHRRVGRQQRPGGGLSGGPGRARRHGRHRPAHGSRRTTSSPACSRPRWRAARSSPPCASRGPCAPAMRSSRTRRRAMPSSA